MKVHELIRCLEMCGPELDVVYYGECEDISSVEESEILVKVQPMITHRLVVLRHDSPCNHNWEQRPNIYDHDIQYHLSVCKKCGERYTFRL